MGARCTGRRSCGDFEVEVYGNGWAYLVTDPDGATLWVQDSDAERLQEDTANFTDPTVLSNYPFELAV